jgi:thioesterase domain-containing protein
VPIQPGGSRPPLFFVHGSGGQPTGAPELSEGLGADQPVYGLRSRGLCGEPPQRTVPAIAAHYIRCIRGVQPHGPYHLSGFCFGGLVAFEMARRLNAQGEKVALLAIFDAPAPGRLRLLDRLRNRVRYDLWKIRRGELPKIVPILATKSRRAARAALRLLKATILGGADAAPDRSPPNREQTILDVSMANVEAAKGYRPGPYSGPITLFLTREVLALYGKDLHEQWRRFGTGPFELCFTGDDHFRQLEPPNIDTVVEQLERRLGRQEGAPRPIVPAAARHRGGGGPAAGTRTGRGWRNPP